MDLTEATTENSETKRSAQSADYAPLHPLTRSWEVARQHVTIEKIIGKGAFGQVAKGTAIGLRGKPGKTTVAVKMLKCKSSFVLLVLFGYFCSLIVLLSNSFNLNKSQLLNGCNCLSVFIN